MIQLKLLKQQHTLPTLAEIVSSGAPHGAGADHNGIVYIAHMAISWAFSY